jgi:acetyl-CoA carboxylase biotin carboxyl carrier protein
MELKEIQDLIKFVAKSGVSEVELESKGFKIVIKTSNTEAVRYIEQAQVVQLPQAVAAPMPVAPMAPAAVPAASAAATPPADTGNLITIKSPMIGTFYRSSGPDKGPFVNVGDEIKAGQTICIIEAMKLFNEIESEVSGTIVKVLVDNSKPVEYDQPLFLVQPK